MKNEHYVEWLTPGSLFPEKYTEKVDSRDLPQLEIPRDVYAFTFYDVKTVDAVDEEGEKHEIRIIINKSPRYIIGEVFTLEQIEAMGKDYRVLASNVEEYDMKSGVKTHLGNWQPLLKDDVVLSTNELRFRKAVIWKNLGSTQTTKEGKE